MFPDEQPGHLVQAVRRLQVAECTLLYFYARYFCVHPFKGIGAVKEILTDHMLSNIHPILFAVYWPHSHVYLMYSRHVKHFEKQTNKPSHSSIFVQASRFRGPECYGSLSHSAIRRRVQKSAAGGAKHSFLLSCLSSRVRSNNLSLGPYVTR